MNKENIKRIRPLKIWEILNQESDEDHPLSTEEIRSRLSECGIECDRRTIYSDIELLNNMGYEILKRRAISNEYYVMDRSFDVPEVLILMDAIQAAGFITKKKTVELVNKIAQLAGSQKGDVLKRNIVEFSTVKSKNENIYYSVNDISEAISSGKKIGFFYFDYDVSCQRKYRVDKMDETKNKWYVVNPLATVFDSDYYYLFCYDDKHSGVAQYRVDRMDKVQVLDEDITPNKAIDNLDLTKRMRQLFGMFGGEVKEVSFNVDKSLLDVVVDKFGDNIRMREVDNHIIATVEVQISPTFLAWCCSFGDKLTVISPKSVVLEVKEYVTSIYEKYNV